MKFYNIQKCIFISIIIVLTQNVYSQDTAFEEQAFFKKLEHSYYDLGSTGVKNFTVLLTNLRTEVFAKNNWNNKEIFPLQLIWHSSDRVFLAEQGVPALSDSSKKTYTPMVSDLKKQITGVLYDLKRFYFSGIDKSISQDYTLKKAGNFIEVKFNSVFEGDSTYFTYYFGENGLCLKIVAETPTKNTKVETYPHFKIVKTKWLVTGWEVQMSENNKIQTGFVINLKSKMYNDVWVPSDMMIAVQQTKTPGTTFNDSIKFRNFLFNQPLQFIQPTK
ncbi:MAG: hypothetical protein D8M58_08625 [Calditrichaeota bacterium]|nr:MAG: hypothetical protein DWQ03_17865 [Calditrichota bacterium]MBL1205447.1 hypothetical protein [Calditrichota bacterium]NOG45276.1 hypothetical protein [Calditrichota bacterium]